MCYADLQFRIRVYMVQETKYLATLTVYLKGLGSSRTSSASKNPLNSAFEVPCRGYIGGEEKIKQKQQQTSCFRAGEDAHILWQKEGNEAEQAWWVCSRTSAGMSLMSEY